MDRARRTLVRGGLAAALLGPALARAQAVSRSARVAVFFNGPPSEGDAGFLAWWQKMMRTSFAEHGYAEGRNFVLEFAFPDAITADRMEAKAREVVAGRPDLVFAFFHAPRIFKRVTQDIPVVFVHVSDPVREGLVETYRRPGGNLTGVSNRHWELLGKRLELLKELRPRAKRAAVLFGAAIDPAPVRQELARASATLGLEVVEIAIPWVITDPARITGTKYIGPDAVIAELKKAKADGFLEIDCEAKPGELWARIQEQAATPGIFYTDGIVKRGGVAYIGTDFDEQVKRAVAIAVRILRGEKPATIPVDQEAKFYLDVNAKSARAMGIEIPASVRVRADRVLESDHVIP